MIKTIAFLNIFFLFGQLVCAQYSDADVFKQMNPSAEKNASVDSLKKLIRLSKDDTTKVILQWKLGNIYMWSFPDSTLHYGLQALLLSQKLGYEKGTIRIYHAMAEVLAVKGDYPKALEMGFKALHLSQQLKDELQTSLSYFWIGITYLYSGDAEKGLIYLHKLQPTNEILVKNRELIYAHIGLGYLMTSRLDSALLFIKRACELDITENNRWCDPFISRAQIYDKMGKYSEALNYYRMGLNIAAAKRDFFKAYNDIASVFLKINLPDSSVYYSRKTIDEAKTGSFFSETIDACKLLVQIFTTRQNIDSVLKYEQLMSLAKDSLLNQQKVKELQNLSFIEQLRQQEELNIQQQSQNKIRMFMMIAVLTVALLIGIIQWRNNKQKQLANRTLQVQKLKLENTLAELNSSQSQIIQLEKEKILIDHEKELHELEAKALRAQMNPHFIFNCMNSIKLLMQQNENDKAINYLTTFSKLIRTIFQNSDKREITLHDEIETCKLYTQLESMRFADKFSYTFSIDKTIDLKLLMVPALIIQPFIENAIWHGIMPKEDGGCVKVIIKRNGESVLCIIDDDGIGRETSNLNRFKGDAHESKGVHLTQSRIDLDNLINQRNASLEIVDKKDEEGNSTGTRVTLTFMEI